MRIGIDVRLWSESGVGRYIRNLVKHLRVLDKQSNYVLFVIKKDYESIKYEILGIKEDDKWRIVIADIRWHSVQEQVKFPSILNKENLDLVHFPYFSVPIFYNKPFVVTIHDLILHHFPTGEASTLPLSIYQLKLLGYKYVISQAVKRARKIIAVSNATKQEILDHLGVNADKIIVTYEGVEKNEKLILRQAQDKNEKPQLKTKKYFLYVGNAYPHKNLEEMITAFGRIRNQESGIKLILVGKEDYFYKRLKENVKEMELSNHVIFYGQANDEELTSLYQNAKALIMPSFMEGFGLPALEAMANKCLVLASNIPSLKEVCQEAAIYFDPYKVEEIARVIRSVCLNDSNLPAGKAGHFNKKIEIGLERSKMFSWEKMAKETLDVYENCLSASHSTLRNESSGRSTVSSDRIGSDSKSSG